MERNSATVTLWKFIAVAVSRYRVFSYNCEKRDRELLPLSSAHYTHTRRHLWTCLYAQFFPVSCHRSLLLYANSPFSYFLFSWHLSLDLCHFGWQNTLLILSRIWHHRQFLSLFSSSPLFTRRRGFFLSRWIALRKLLLLVEFLFVYFFASFADCFADLFLFGRSRRLNRLSYYYYTDKCIVVYLASRREQSENSFVWIDRSLSATTHRQCFFF